MSAPSYRARVQRRVSLIVVLCLLVLGSGIATAMWEYGYVSCGWGACTAEPAIEGWIGWEPATFTTAAWAHSCVNGRNLEGSLIRTAPNGCWVPRYIRLWSEQASQSHLFVLGDINWTDPTGQRLYCDGDDVVTDTSEVC